MSRRNISRERNERGLQLFMQNLKGVVSLFLASQDITWTEELKDQTSWRLEDAYTTLTLMENDIAHVRDAEDSLRESMHLLLGYIQSLHSYITSYENTVSDDSDVSFSNRIPTINALLMGEDSSVASSKCINTSEKTQGIWNWWSSWTLFWHIWSRFGCNLQRTDSSRWKFKWRLSYPKYWQTQIYGCPKKSRNSCSTLESKSVSKKGWPYWHSVEMEIGDLSPQIQCTYTKLSLALWLFAQTD